MWSKTIFISLKKIRLIQFCSIQNRFKERSLRCLSYGKYEDRDHAELYSKYRPTYPDEVYRIILEFCRAGEKYKQKNLDLAVDVGCGNGQSTLPLCMYFKHVIGYDVSFEQIEHAPKAINNVTFKVGPAEDLSFLHDQSVDLLTSFQAVHWFDLDKFYKEVTRVIKIGGVFAAFGYDVSSLNKEFANLEYKKFYKEKIQPYLNPPSLLCYGSRYRTIGFPFDTFIRVETEEVSIRRQMSVDAFVGYLASSAGWRNYLRQHPSTSALDLLRSRLDSIYNGSAVEVTWPGFLLIGKNNLASEKTLMQDIQ